jgi:nitric oxide reductase NorE protein
MLDGPVEDAPMAEAGGVIAKPSRTRPHLPGEVGIWVFVLGDMTVFALFFAAYMFYRGQDADLYVASQASLDQNIGVVNTLLLLASSWLVALGVHRIRVDGPSRGSALFGLAALCGVAFAALKVFEYRHQAALGHILTTNDFYMFYYVLTGIHLMHVLIGLVVLTYLWHTSRRHSAADLMLVESGATYWHMVDLLWIVLFPLLYLAR